MDHNLPLFFLKIWISETSLAVQWLRLHASMAGDEGSITGQETKILQPKIKIFKLKKYINLNIWSFWWTVKICLTLLPALGGTPLSLSRRCAKEPPRNWVGCPFVWRWWTNPGGEGGFWAQYRVCQLDSCFSRLIQAPLPYGFPAANEHFASCICIYYASLQRLFVVCALLEGQIASWSLTLVPEVL